MKPKNLSANLFLDSGDPNETREAIKLLGFLDGQTTNPTLISKNPLVIEKLKKGDKFTKEKIYNFYKETVREISSIIPNGSVSIETYADKDTSASEMYEQGREMFSWIPNAHIKFPTTKEGLIAAERSVKEGIRVNMTLCFSQEQAAAVYSATKDALQQNSLRQSIGQAGQAKQGDVFVSPFIGRLDDRGENGMSLIENIIKMYQQGDGHVEVLSASIRSIEHFLYAIKLKSDIITAPISIYRLWKESGMRIPDENYAYNQGQLRNIPYLDLSLGMDWKMFNIEHELTDKGIEKFSSDWNSLINPN